MPPFKGGRNRVTAPNNFALLEFPSKPQNVGFARTAAALFASQLEFTLDEIEEIKVATSEAVSNAVVHGYGSEEGPIRMRLEIAGEDLVITVEDDGRGIEDIEWARQPANTTQPDEHMGLGLVFINEYMNEVRIQSRPGRGTVVRMVKTQASAKPVKPGRVR